MWILPLSAAIAGFLIWLIYLKTTRAAAPAWIGVLPAANAVFNSLSAAALAAGYREHQARQPPGPHALHARGGRVLGAASS